MSTQALPIQCGFEYEVRLAVSIPIAWATLLKQSAEHHYDYKCRAAGHDGVVNGLYNTSIGGPLQSNYAVSWRDLDLVTKVAEQLEHHTNDHALIRAIRVWLRATMDVIAHQRDACMKLPGITEEASSELSDPVTQPRQEGVSTQSSHAYPVNTRGVQMLTADTITDDQIRALRDGERGLLHPDIRDLCRVAMQIGSPAKSPPSHPLCQQCSWRKGGTDSWDGYRCKCGHSTGPWHVCGTCHGLGTTPYGIGSQPCSSCDRSGLVDLSRRILARARIAEIFNER